MKFLVVDDSPTMRRIVINTLKTIGEESVIEAADGKEAFAKLTTEGADFIITDWNMPEMNGRDFVTAVRSTPRRENIPIIMVTTRGNKEDVLEAMQAGVDNYMVKPFTAPGLKEKIESVLTIASPTTT